MEQLQGKQGKNCRHGVNCKYILQNRCKFYHPMEEIEQVQKIQNSQTEEKNIQQEEDEEQSKQFTTNEFQKQKGQSLKDYYLQMMQKEQTITNKAKYIESLAPGFSDNPNIRNNEYNYYNNKEADNNNSYNEKIQLACQQYKQLQSVRIGIDFGNVICGSDPQGLPDPNEDTMFGQNYLNTPQVPGAFEGVKFLIDTFGAENIFIVSKCGAKVQQKSIEWMAHNKFQEQTGFLMDKNKNFCKERSEKAGICQKLQINFFIDDRQDVFQHMNDNIVKILFPSQGKKPITSKKLICVEGWKHIIDIFTKINIQKK